MTIDELTPLVSLADGNVDLVRYHAKAMIEAGALDAAAPNQAQAEGESEQPSLFFPLPR